MSFDIPRLVLPRGEIHNLPIITPTQFYQSVTPRLHTHALHLQTMPVLSHMFNNVSVSNVVDALKRETVFHGAGAFINPAASSSVSVFVTTNDVQPMLKFPSIQEIHVKNGVIAQKITQNDPSTNGLGIHKHKDLANQIETSFKDINHNIENHFSKTAELFLTGTTYKTIDASESNQKIFTLLTDVFVIMGSNSGVAIEPTSYIPPINNINLQSELNEFVEEKVQIKKKPIPSSLQRLSPSSQDILPILIATETHSQTHLTAGTKNEVNHNMFTVEIICSDKGQKQEIVNDPVPADNNIELNELVVDLPVQEEIVPVTENVEWINLFNQPQKTVEVHVGDILNTNSSNWVEPIHNNDELAVSPGAEVVDLSLGIQTETGSNSMLSNSNKQNVQHFMNTFFQIPTYDNATHFDNIKKTMNANAEMAARNRPLPNVITRQKNTVQQNGDKRYPQIANNLRMQQPKRDFDLSWRRLQNHVKNIKVNTALSTNSQIPGVTLLVNEDAGVNSNIDIYNQNLRGNISLSNKQKRFHQPIDLDTKTINFTRSSFRMPQFRFNLRKGLLNGRNALVISHPNRSTQNKNIQIRQNSKVTENRQPWNFLKRVGVNLAFYDPGIARRHIFGTDNTNTKVPTSVQRQAFNQNLGITERRDMQSISRKGPYIRDGNFRPQKGGSININGNFLKPYQEMILGKKGMILDIAL
jgi:hypothetical protein